MCPAQVIDINDPAFTDNPQDLRDLDAELRHNPVARILDQAGLTSKRDRTLMCQQFVWLEKCPEHGVMKTRVFGCGGRWCPDCRQRIMQATILRHQDMLEGVPTLPGHVVLCNLEYPLPLPFTSDNLPALRVWAKKVLGRILFQLDSHLQSIPYETYFRSAFAHGIAKRGDHYHLLCSTLVAASDTVHKGAWRKLFPDAVRAWVDRAGTHMVRQFFERHITTHKPETQESEGLHEVLFHNFRLLRSCLKIAEQAELSVSEEAIEGDTDNSLDFADPAPEPLSHPRGTCRICGRACFVTLENRYEQHLAPPELTRLALSD